MRILVTFFLILFADTLFAQNNIYRKVDSIAKAYLNIMYITKDFVNGAKMWDTTNLIETHKHNLSRYPRHDTSMTVLQYLSTNFLSSRQNLNQFYFSDKFDISESKPLENLLQFFVKYNYSEIGFTKNPINSAILVLRSSDSGDNWKILDLRILDY